MSIRRNSINNVFTPRRDTVNNKMYVDREALEDEFVRKINGYKHIIMYGESGSGKSWLYKKVLKQKKIKYYSINLANAIRMGSITNLFNDELSKIQEFKKSGYLEQKATEANVAFAKGILLHENQYQKSYQDPVRLFLKHIKKENGVVVLDNLEAIFGNQSCMDELGNILILLDDEEYKAKFIIVGVPSGVIEYFNNRVLLKTVANRITELKEVGGLNEAQVLTFVKKGFVDELKVTLSNAELQRLSEHVLIVTNGIPQKLHEYCEVLAYDIEKNGWTYKEEYLEQADKQIVLDNLHKNYLLISDMMNSNETDVGRRNQVLYSLGKINKQIFKAGEIEQVLRAEFPNSTQGKVLSISLILNEIAAWQNTFLKRTSKEYIIMDMEYILCIRMMLVKLPTQKVEKRDIKSMG